jgi:hypothetical protein
MKMKNLINSKIKNKIEENIEIEEKNLIKKENSNTRTNIQGNIIVNNQELNKEKSKLEKTTERVQNEVKNIIAETTLNSLDDNTLKLTTKENFNKDENNKNSNINLDNYSKEDLLTLLINNPINIEEDDEEEEREEQINLNLNFNSKIPEEPENEEEDSDFHKALTKVLSKMAKNKNVNNNELFDLLVSDKEVVERELKKFHFNKKNNISDKIPDYIDRKKQKFR